MCKEENPEYVLLYSLIPSDAWFSAAVLSSLCRTCGNLHRVRIMTCPDVVAMYMHPLLLKACFLLDTILFLELLFLSLIFWICCVVDVLFFIPVSNGCFCTLICKRYAVMEESLIKRIQLAVAVQIFVLLLLIIYSPDCIYLDSADELFLGLFLLFHKLRECFFLMVNCVSRNSEKSFLYSINDQYILSYMYFASLIIGSRPSPPRAD